MCRTGRRKTRPQNQCLHPRRQSKIAHMRATVFRLDRTVSRSKVARLVPDGVLKALPPDGEVWAWESSSRAPWFPESTPLYRGAEAGAPVRSYRTPEIRSREHFLGRPRA